MTGNISKIKIFEFTNKKGEKGEIGTFTFHSNKTGYIDCKCFIKDDIDDLKNINEKDEITINLWYPRKESWIDKNGIKQYRTCLIVECFEVNGRVETNQQPEQKISQPQPQPEENEFDDFDEFNELDWEKEFN